MRAALAGVLAGLALAVAVATSAYAGGATPQQVRPNNAICDVCAALPAASGR